MKIRANRTLRGDAGNIRRDAEVDLPDSTAKHLIKRGYAVAIDEPEAADEGSEAKSKAKPHVKARAKSKAKIPPTGAAAPTEGE